MMLTDLDPEWVFSGGEGVSDQHGNPRPLREGVGLEFDCPCGCASRAYVTFHNPLDGGPVNDPSRPAWTREGHTFETLTLRPSILRTPPYGCGWHGFITNGVVTVA